MLEGIKKISIIGGSGTGKTTLADNLAGELGLPVYHLDGLNYSENWKENNKDKRDKIILEKIAQPQWIMDGTYTSTLERRLQASDFIIYLDYTSLAQARGVMGRFLKNHGKEKAEIPGCKEKMTFSFFFWVLRWRGKKRKYIVELVNKIDQNKVMLFKNRKQLSKWYRKTFNKDIIIK